MLIEIDPAHFRSVLGNDPSGVCVGTGYRIGHSADGIVIDS